MTEKKKKHPKTHTLTPRERELVGAYDGSIAEAARRIGMDPRNARHVAERPRVKAAMQKKMDAAVTECGKRLGRDMAVTTSNVLKELARLAFSDPRKFFTETGTAVPIPQLDDDTAMALAGFEVVELFEGRGEDRVKTGELKKFKIADKGQNLERLGKYLGMFIDRHMNLPADFSNRTEEEQEHFCQHGYYPDAVDAGKSGPSSS